MALRDLLPDTLLPAGFKDWVTQASDRVDSIPTGGADGDLVGQDGAGAYQTVAGTRLAVVADTAPTEPRTDQLWYDRPNRQLKRWTDDQWELAFSGTFNRAEARDIRRDGGVLDGSTSDTQAVKDALAASNTALIADGTCLIDGTITLSNDQIIVIAENAEVVVPNGYASVLFRFHGKRARVDGAGNISELGTEAQNWTAFQWDGSDNQGCHQCDVGPVHVDKPGTLFLLDENNTGGYVNGNYARGTRCLHPIIIWDFVNTSGNVYNLSRNGFFGVDVQGSASTTHVFRNLTGAEMGWHGCTVFDAGGATVEVADTARDMLIVGGSGIEPDPTKGQNTQLITPQRNTLRTVSPIVFSAGDVVPDGTDATQAMVGVTPVINYVAGDIRISLRRPQNLSYKSSIWDTISVVMWWAPASDTADGDVYARLDRYTYDEGDDLSATAGAAFSVLFTVPANEANLLQRTVLAAGVQWNGGQKEWASMNLERWASNSSDTAGTIYVAHFEIYEGDITA